MFYFFTLLLPLVVVDVLGKEFVFDGGVLSRDADGDYAERDNVFGKTEHVLYQFSAVHIGMQARPDGSKTHGVSGEKEVLCGSGDIVDPEVRHLARDCFGQVSARDDCYGRMIAATRVGQSFAELGDEGFVRDDDKRPRLFVDRRRRSHGRTKESVDLRLADLFARKLTYGDAGHDVFDSLIFHNLRLLIAGSENEGCECKKNEFFHMCIFGRVFLLWVYYSSLSLQRYG